MFKIGEKLNYIHITSILTWTAVDSDSKVAPDFSMFIVSLALIEP